MEMTMKTDSSEQKRLKQLKQKQQVIRELERWSSSDERFYKPLLEEAREHLAAFEKSLKKNESV